MSNWSQVLYSKLISRNGKPGGAVVLDEARTITTDEKGIVPLLQRSGVLRPSASEHIAFIIHNGANTIVGIAGEVGNVLGATSPYAFEANKDAPGRAIRFMHAFHSKGRENIPTLHELQSTQADHLEDILRKAHTTLRKFTPIEVPFNNFAHGEVSEWAKAAKRAARGEVFGTVFDASGKVVRQLAVDIASNVGSAKGKPIFEPLEADLGDALKKKLPNSTGMKVAVAILATVAVGGVAWLIGQGWTAKNRNQIDGSSSATQSRR